MASPAGHADADVADVDARALVALARDSGDSAAQERGVAALARFAGACTGNALAARDAGALAAVVALLRARPSEGDFFEAACYALVSLLNAGGAHAWNAAHVGALDAALCGMAAQLRDAEMQLSGCEVLQALFDWCVEGSDDVGSHAGGAAGSVLAALRANTHAKSLHELGWRVLHSVCFGRPPAARRAVDGGAFDVVVASLRAHAADASVHSKACAFMFALFTTSQPDMHATRAAACAAGAVGAALAAIRVISENACANEDDLFDPALSLLHALIVGNGPAEAEAVRGGALEMVLALLPRALTDTHGIHLLRALVGGRCPGLAALGVGFVLAAGTGQRAPGGRKAGTRATSDHQPASVPAHTRTTVGTRRRARSGARHLTHAYAAPPAPPPGAARGVPARRL
jgi:hypothetical protein